MGPRPGGARLGGPEPAPIRRDPGASRRPARPPGVPPECEPLRAGTSRRPPRGRPASPDDGCRRRIRRARGSRGRSKREGIGGGRRLELGCGQRLDGAGLAEPDQAVEPAREHGLGVVAQPLGLGPVDDADEALRTLAPERLAPIVGPAADVEKEATRGCPRHESAPAALAGGQHGLDLGPAAQRLAAVTVPRSVPEPIGTASSPHSRRQSSPRLISPHLPMPVAEASPMGESCARTTALAAGPRAFSTARSVSNICVSRRLQDTAEPSFMAPQ